MKQHHHLQPLRFLLVGAILFSIFFFWLLSVVLPITLIELRYDYQKALSDVFHVTDIRGLVLPQFRTDITGASSHYTTDGITIPSVFIDEPIIYNVDPNNMTAYLSALKHGIAHASGTALPGLPAGRQGSGGLGYYFAHSSTASFARQLNAVFYLLDKIAIGDPIYVWHEGIKHTYSVYAKQITTPNDISFLHRAYPTDTIVLQTCWPPGTTSERLLIFATAKDR